MHIHWHWCRLQGDSLKIQELNKSITTHNCRCRSVLQWKKQMKAKAKLRWRLRSTVLPCSKQWEHVSDFKSHPFSHWTSNVLIAIIWVMLSVLVLFGFSMQKRLWYPNPCRCLMVWFLFLSVSAALEYRHELGMNFAYVLPDLIVGSCLQVSSKMIFCIYLSLVSASAQCCRSHAWCPGNYILSCKIIWLFLATNCHMSSWPS